MARILFLMASLALFASIRAEDVPSIEVTVDRLTTLQFGYIEREIRNWSRTTGDEIVQDLVEEVEQHSRNQEVLEEVKTKQWATFRTLLDAQARLVQESSNKKVEDELQIAKIPDTETILTQIRQNIVTRTGDLVEKIVGEQKDRFAVEREYYEDTKEDLAKACGSDLECNLRLARNTRRFLRHWVPELNNRQITRQLRIKEKLRARLKTIKDSIVVKQEAIIELQQSLVDLRNATHAVSDQIAIDALKRTVSLVEKDIEDRIEALNQDRVIADGIRAKILDNHHERTDERGVEALNVHNRQEEEKEEGKKEEKEENRVNDHAANEVAPVAERAGEPTQQSQTPENPPVVTEAVAVPRENIAERVEGGSTQAPVPAAETPVIAEKVTEQPQVTENPVEPTVIAAEAIVKPVVAQEAKPTTEPVAANQPVVEEAAKPVVQSEVAQVVSEAPVEQRVVVQIDKPIETAAPVGTEARADQPVNVQTEAPVEQQVAIKVETPVEHSIASESSVAPAVVSEPASPLEQPVRSAEAAPSAEEPKAAEQTNAVQSALAHRRVITALAQMFSSKNSKVAADAKDGHKKTSGSAPVAANLKAIKALLTAFAFKKSEPIQDKLPKQASSDSRNKIGDVHHSALKA